MYVSVHGRAAQAGTLAGGGRVGVLLVLVDMDLEDGRIVVQLGATGSTVRVCP